MSFPVRILAGLSVMMAMVLALLALPHPAPPVFVRLEAQIPAPVSGPAAGAAAEWIGRVRQALEAAHVPIRGKKLDALLGTVDASARRFGIDPLAVVAIIQIESEFDPLAVSPRGAMGLMQLRADTARELAEELGIPWLSDEVLLDPDVNILLGTFYLSRLVKRFGDLDDALVAFNAGPARVEIFREQGGSVPLEYANRVWDAIIRMRVRTIA